jgi:NAD-dependent SIR2 family protein deacetylase
MNKQQLRDIYNRVFFIGAGASKQDKFPLTNELKYGLAWAICKEKTRLQPLKEHLRYLYNVQENTLKAGTAFWDRKLQADNSQQDDLGKLPDVTDLLSTLDWMIREESSFGPGLNTGKSEVSKSAIELAYIRDLVVQALCYSLDLYMELKDASTSCNFIEHVKPNDSIITTNWDLLLDAARDTKFGSKPEDYGTTGNVALEGSTIHPCKKRPKLLKLHGSLSWRYCPRCQRLVIDPLHHVAGEREQNATCLCNCKYSELIVTPSFVREYRNVHLLTIWREALMTLARSPEWVFIGYSLPPDDIGIRTLLLKARCIRKDAGLKDPVVTIVTGSNGREETVKRYNGVLTNAKLYKKGDFGNFVSNGLL